MSQTKRKKRAIWKTAIGLQQVDGLKPSTYLFETAKQNIDGDITFPEVKNRIEAYYKTATSIQALNEDRTEEADRVSTHIAEILFEKTFSFFLAEYLNIHKRLFADIYEFAGKIREYNITKAEWALNGDTVLYAGADNLSATLEYDFNKEKKFSYKQLTQQQTIEHIARFISDLWQIHPFGEGNTRTTAVFLIKYLRELGFKNMDDDSFAQHSEYFRNALVRANYKNIKDNVYPAIEYLENFLKNFLLGEKIILNNRELHIHHSTMEKPLQTQSDIGRPLATSTNEPKIVFTEPPSGCCPVQAEGFVDGYPFYFRSRWEHMRFNVAASGRASAWANVAWSYVEKYKDGEPFAAGGASTEECLEFINRAAARWFSDKGGEICARWGEPGSRLGLGRIEICAK